MNRHHVEVHLATARVNPAPGDALPTAPEWIGQRLRPNRLRRRHWYPEKGGTAHAAKRLCKT
jgi:hypothetical protein